MRRLPAGGTQETGLIAVVLLLGLLLTFGADPVRLATGEVVNNFLRLDNIIPNVATPMSWIAIMALGVTVVIVAGGIDISIGSIFGLAALGTAAVLQRLDEHAGAVLVWPLAASVALGIGAACGLVNGLLVVGLRMHPFIVTLGTLTIFRGLALVSVAEKSLPSGARTLPLALTSGGVAWPLQIPRTGLPPLRIEPVPMLIMLLCGVLTAVLLSRTVLGRQLYAIGGNEEAARFSGIPVARAKLVAYVLSGLAAGIAGFISTGYFGSANTATGEGYELHVIAAAVVGGASLSGGRGTALGALLGALVIKLIENGIFILKQINFGLFVLPLSKEYSKIIIGIAIILAVATDRCSEYIRARAARVRPAAPPRP